MSDAMTNILSRTKSKRNPIFVQLTEYEGHRLLDVRRFFLDQKDGEYKPTRKGIALNRDNFSDVMTIIGECSQAISEWFGVSGNIGVKGKVLSAIEQDGERTLAAMQGAAFSEQDTLYEEFADRRYPFPYRHEPRGGVTHVATNTDHPLHQSEVLRSANPNAPAEMIPGEILDVVFEAYFSAARRIESTSPDGYVNPESLEAEWDRELRMRLAARRAKIKKE